MRVCFWAFAFHACAGCPLFVLVRWCGSVRVVVSARSFVQLRFCVCLCVCVCVCEFLRVGFVCTSFHVCPSVLKLCLYVCVCGVSLCFGGYVCLCVHFCACVFLCAWLSVCVCLYVCACLCVFLRLRVFVLLFFQENTQTHKHMHKYRHTQSLHTTNPQLHTKTQ